jgi:hypothetical protein
MGDATLAVAVRPPMIHTGWSPPDDGCRTSYTINSWATQLGVHVKVGVVEDVTDTVSGRLGQSCGAEALSHASKNTPALANATQPRLGIIPHLTF